MRAQKLPAENVWFQSHSTNTLQNLREATGTDNLIYLTKLRRSFPWVKEPSSKVLAEKLEGNRINFVSMKGRSFINDEFLAPLREKNIQVLVWTINNPDHIAHYAELDVAGIITDIIEP